MPLKVKPLPKKPTKKESAAAAAMPPDPLTSHYYADGVDDYADVVFLRQQNNAEE